MQRIILLMLILSLGCCNSKKDLGKLNIDKNNINSIWIKCKKQGYAPYMQEKLYKVSAKEYEKIVKKINLAQKGILPDSIQKEEYRKGNITELIKIVLKPEDTLHLTFLRGAFMWRDSMYKTDLDMGGYLSMQLCIKCAENELSIDSLWNMLVFIRGGCLVEGQNVTKGVFGGEGCVLTSSPFWTGFFERPKEELTPFLINKFPSRKETDIHVCPFEKADEGELSVYCLHKIYMKNWYDFEVFKEFKDKEITGRMNSEQMWLRKILKNEKQRTILKELWLNEMNKK